jgi:hypothetical protein
MVLHLERDATGISQISPDTKPTPTDPPSPKPTTDHPNTDRRTASEHPAHTPR